MTVTSANPVVAAPVITIDGPTASGKGTVAHRVAKALGWDVLDSGALYRLTALAAMRQGVAAEDEPAVARVAETLDVRFDGPHVYLEGGDVGHEIRREEVGNFASRVAAFPGVRQALLERQRAFRVPPGLVADGRDMGTVVFPDASLKVFLVADVVARAERRRKQLIEKEFLLILTTFCGICASGCARYPARGRAARSREGCPGAGFVESDDRGNRASHPGFLAGIRKRLTRAFAHSGFSSPFFLALLTGRPSSRDIPQGTRRPGRQAGTLTPLRRAIRCGVFLTAISA